jgi:hypothetical protein
MVGTLRFAHPTDNEGVLLFENVKHNPRAYRVPHVAVCTASCKESLSPPDYR